MTPPTGITVLSEVKATAAENRRTEVVGVMGGSFNPVHRGHLALAQALVASGEVDKVLLVLSPLNPLKASVADMLAPDADRLAMLRLATEGIPEVEPCDVELSMPRPSYTIDTMRLLQRRMPGVKLRLVMGADNMLVFDRWRAHEQLLRDFAPVVYPRGGCEVAQVPEGFTYLADLTVHPESSTEVRRRIAAGEDANNMLPPGVLNYIECHGLYKG